MPAFLPDTVDAWTVSEPSRLYSGKEIFKYMDGAGEVYLAYRFETLLVQRYACPEQEEILVEIFDMGDARNAFGISTYMRGRGPSVRIGQDGEYKSGLLCFWRGRYYVCIRIEKENRAATTAIKKAGRMIAKAIGADGERPHLLRFLPVREYRSESLRYFYRDEILGTHITLPEGNLLHLTDSTEGLLACAKRDRSSLLIIAYPDSIEAGSAYRSVVKGYLPAIGTGGIVKTHSGTWTACCQREKHLWLILDAPTKKRAQDLMAAVERRLP